MTESARQALLNLRNPSLFEWYVIPLLTIAALAYANEFQKKNWNGISAGLTYFGLDMFIEIANSVLFRITGFAPAWCTPGKTAYLILIGMNIEICFMFALVGLVMSKFLPENKNMRIFGIPGRLAVAACAALFCATVEIILNSIGVLVWEYPWWNQGPASIFIYSGYFIFFMITFHVHDIESIKEKFKAVGIIFLIDAALVAVFGPFLGWL